MCCSRLLHFLLTVVGERRCSLDLSYFPAKLWHGYVSEISDWFSRSFGVTRPLFRANTFPTGHSRSLLWLALLLWAYHTSTRSNQCRPWPAPCFSCAVFAAEWACLPVRGASLTSLALPFSWLFWTLSGRWSFRKLSRGSVGHHCA